MKILSFKIYVINNHNIIGWSTYSGYINRIRGYQSVKNEEEGFELGHLNSYYFLPKEKKNQMIQYYPIKNPILCMREFPVDWLRSWPIRLETLNLENVF